jgi:hypothetical protein
VSITTKVVSLNPNHGKVYLIQFYVIKFVSDLRQVCGFQIPTVAGGTNKAGAVNTQGGGGGTSGGKIGIIVSVFLVAIVVCVLLIVFHKAERR